MGFTNLFPDEYLPSAGAVDYERLYAEGYRGVIFDIDNTLVPHNAPADDGARALIVRLHSIGYRVLVLSNNKEPRVKSFADAAGMDGYVYRGGKPAARGYLAAMDALGTDVGTTLFVGDQIFTDIWGARRLGIHSILTEPVQKWHEEPQIILKRFLEAPIIFLYKRFI